MQIQLGHIGFAEFVFTTCWLSSDHFPLFVITFCTSYGSLMILLYAQMWNNILFTSIFGSPFIKFLCALSFVNHWYSGSPISKSTICIVKIYGLHEIYDLKQLNFNFSVRKVMPRSYAWKRLQNTSNTQQ